jgi:glucose dehydrogenase
MQKLSASAVAIALSCSLVGAAEWLTFGGDPQRSGWAKEETTLAKDNVKQLQLEWKLKLENEPKQLNALTVPVVVNPVYTNHGSFEYVIVAGSSDNLFAVDADWQARLAETFHQRCSPAAEHDAGRRLFLSGRVERYAGH